MFFASAGASTPADFAKALREGTPPKWSEAERNVAVGRLQAQLRGLRIRLEARMDTGEPRCARFRAAFVDTIMKLNPALEVSPGALDPERPEPEFWEGVRLRLLLSAFFAQSKVFSIGADGGYESMNRAMTFPCPVQRRPEVVESVEAISIGLATFMREGLGAPGLDQLDQIGWRLLAYGKRAESHRFRNELYLNGSIVLASLVVLRYVPPVFTTALTRSPLVRYGVTPVLLGLEGLAIHHGLEYFNPAELRSLENGVGGWDDLMTEVEALLAAPVEAPERAYLYVAATKAILARVYREHIEDEPTIARADEALALIGQGVAGTAALLRERLMTDHGLRVDCDLSKFRCVRGLQMLARLLYDRRVKPLERGEDEAFRIAFDRGPELRFTSDDDAVTLHAPVNADENALVSLIAEARAGAAVPRRAVAAIALADDLHKLQKFIPQTVEFDPRLTRTERWRVTMELMGLAARRPELFARNADVLRIGRVFRPPFEENMRLVEGLRADAGAKDLERALDDRWAEPLQAGWMRARARIRQLTADIRRETGHGAVCAEDGALTVRECCTALEAWLALARSKAPATAQDVEVYARKVLGSGWDLKNEKLAISPGFDPGELPSPLGKKAAP